MLFANGRLLLVGVLYVRVEDDISAGCGGMRVLVMQAVSEWVEQSALLLVFARVGLLLRLVATFA